MCELILSIIKHPKIITSRNLLKINLQMMPGTDEESRNIILQNIPFSLLCHTHTN